MRHMTIVIALAALADCTAAPAARAAASPDSARAVAYIRGRIALWVEQTARGDSAADEIWATGMEGWYSHGAEYGDSAAFAVAGVPWVRGNGSSTWSVQVEEVAVGGDIAAVHDIWTETRHFKGSTATAHRVIRGSEMWRRQSDGRWRIARWVDALEHWVRD
jgi:hypothetical protein